MGEEGDEEGGEEGGVGGEGREDGGDDLHRRRGKKSVIHVAITM